MWISYIHWKLNPEMFNLFGFAVRYYGLLFVGGLILCSYVIQKIYEKESLPLSLLNKLLIYGMIGIFAGARLGHCLFYEPSYYLSHPLEMLLPIQPVPGGGYRLSGYQGLASHGGTFGLMIAMMIYSKKTKIPLLKIVDIIAIVAPLGACFIRLANLMNSEIIGIPTTVPWAFIFENEDNLPRHPAQLYESIAYLSLFVFLFWLYRTGRAQIQTGIFFGLSISLIFVSRFCIEFVKERQVPFEQQMQLDMGQLLSLPFIVVGICFVVVGLRKAKIVRGS